MHFKLGDTVSVKTSEPLGDEGLINNKGFIFYLANIKTKSYSEFFHEVKGNLNKKRKVWRFETKDLTHSKLMLTEKFFEFKSEGGEVGLKPRVYELDR